MATRKINYSEKDYQAEMDAETLARYEEIMADASRRKAAVSKARERASELQKRADMMSRVSGNHSASPKKN